MIERLRRLLARGRDGSPRDEERVIPATDSERRFDAVRRDAERVIRLAEASNETTLRQMPSWEELLIGKERR